MSSDETATRPDGASPRRELTDPRAMRALAHPVRLALIELLAHTGTLTATQASEALAESPANCAFHLRTLARYGFVEEAGGGRGRERPWRRVYSGIEISGTQASPQATQGAKALIDFLAETLLERARGSLAARSTWPAEWQAVLPQNQGLSYMTVPEARQLGTELAALLSRYDDRLGHPERRPAGAMPIEILTIAYPLLHLSQIETHLAATRPEADPED